MYRCKECSKEFEIKPDYCDCGNDEFEEIIENVEIEKRVESFKERAKEEPAKELKKELNNDAKKEVKANKEDIFARTFFVFCLILSVFVLVFCFNPKSSNDVNGLKSSTETVSDVQKGKQKSIPKIDEIWNSTPSKQVNENKKIDNTISLTLEEKMEKNIEKPKNEQDKKNQNKINSSIPNTSNNSNTANTANTIKAPKVTSSTSNTNATSTVAFAQELKNYKIALRNKIASKIDFLSVVGDGNCTVVFKISSNGTLTERKFQKQSDNDSLNDAVYKAVLSVPSYNPPPKGYNNELLRLNVKIVGENFEVSLN